MKKYLLIPMLFIAALATANAGCGGCDSDAKKECCKDGEKTCCGEEKCCAEEEKPCCPADEEHKH